MTSLDLPNSTVGQMVGFSFMRERTKVQKHTPISQGDGMTGPGLTPIRCLTTWSHCFLPHAGCKSPRWIFCKMGGEVKAEGGRGLTQDHRVTGVPDTIEGILPNLLLVVRGETETQRGEGTRLRSHGELVASQPALLFPTSVFFLLLYCKVRRETVRDGLFPWPFGEREKLT